MDGNGLGTVCSQVAGQQAAQVFGAAGDQDDLAVNAVQI